MVMTVMSAVALRGLLRGLLNLRECLLRPSEISGLQILTQGLEILRQRGQGRLRAACRSSRR
jgi:hypothetical protein